MTHWTESFYPQQDALTGCYTAPIHPFHTALASRVTAQLGRPGTLLELGAGGGQFAVSAALLGHAVTALDLWAGAGEFTRRLARTQGVNVEVVTGSFYDAPLPRTFDAVCYWDGFGIGKDAEQRHLLTRLHDWLAPAGTGFVEVYTPWYWARHAGFTRQDEAYTQGYGFEADGCRMTDTYTPAAGDPITQSLRCYSPADLRLLLAGTGLTLTGLWPGGEYDPGTRTWHPEVPLARAQSYTALLTRDSTPS